MSPQLRLFPQKSLLGCHFHVSLSISTRNLWQFPFKKGCHFLFLVAKSAIILGNRSKKLSIYSSSFKATLIFCELFWEVFLNVSNHLKIGIKSDKIVNFKVIFKKILWVIKNIWYESCFWYFDNFYVGFFQFSVFCKSVTAENEFARGIIFAFLLAIISSALPL